MFFISSYTHSTVHTIPPYPKYKYYSTIIGFEGLVVVGFLILMSCWGGQSVHVCTQLSFTGWIATSADHSLIICDV